MPTIEFNTTAASTAYMRIPTITRKSSGVSGSGTNQKAESIDLSGGNFVLATWVALKNFSSETGIWSQQTNTTNALYIKTKADGTIEVGCGDGTTTITVPILSGLSAIGTLGSAYAWNGYVPIMLIVRGTKSAGTQTIRVDGWTPYGGWSTASSSATVTITAPSGTDLQTASQFGTGKTLQASQIPVNQYPDTPAVMMRGPLRICTYSSSAIVPSMASMQSALGQYIESVLDHPTAFGDSSGTPTWTDTWIDCGTCMTNLDILSGAGTLREEWYGTGMNTAVTIASYSSYWEGTGFTGSMKLASDTRGLLGQGITSASTDPSSNPASPSTVISGTHIHRDPYELFPRVFVPRTSLYPESITTGPRTSRGRMRLLREMASGTTPNGLVFIGMYGQSWCNYGDATWDNDSTSDVAAGIRAGNDLRQGMSLALLPRLAGIIFDFIPGWSTNQLDAAEGRLGFPVVGGGATNDYYQCTNCKASAGTGSIFRFGDRSNWFRFSLGDRNVMGGDAAAPMAGRWCGGGALYVGQSTAGVADSCAFGFERPAGSVMRNSTTVRRVDVLLKYPGAPNTVYYQGEAKSTRTTAVPATFPGSYLSLTGNDTTVCTAQIATSLDTGGSNPVVGTANTTIDWMTGEDVLTLKSLSATAWITAAITEIDAFRTNAIDPANDWWAIYDDTTQELAIITEMSYNSGNGILTVKSGRVYMTNGTANPVGQAGWQIDFSAWASGRSVRIGKVSYRAVTADVVVNQASTKYARIAWYSPAGAKMADGSTTAGPMVVIPGGAYSPTLSGYVVMGGGSGSLNYERVDNACQPGSITRLHRAVHAPEIGVMMQTLHATGGSALQEWYDVAIRRTRYINPNMHFGAIFLPSWNTRHYSTDTNNNPLVHGVWWVYRPTATLQQSRNDFRRVFSQYRVPYIDFFEDTGAACNHIRGWNGDTVHFNSRGNRKISQMWMSEIRPLCGGDSVRSRVRARFRGSIH